VKSSLPAGRTGQLLALGLTALVLAAIWQGFATPLIAWHRERAEALAQRTELARRMATLVTAAPALLQEAAAVAVAGAGNPALLEGDSDSTASASAALSGSVGGLRSTQKSLTVGTSNERVNFSSSLAHPNNITIRNIGRIISVLMGHLPSLSPVYRTFQALFYHITARIGTMPKMIHK
jgi:hypothetical protein